MSVQVENLEQKNMVKLTIEREAKELDAAINTVYKRQRSKIAIPGFRKGKAPLPMIERMYGAEVFFEDAANEIINETYPDAVKESKLDIVSQPEIEVTQIERGKTFIYTATVAIKPAVKLGEYKGVNVKKADTSVSNSELDKEIEVDRNKNARIITVDDAVKEGDDAIIDYEGYVGDKKFDGGTDENYTLTIGSHTFIEGFEDQIIGHKKGDKFDVNVTFPSEYHAADLAGKPAVFKVVVKEVKRKELPELNDDFVQDISEYDTVAEYKKALKKRIAERKELAHKSEKENEVLDKIIESAEMDIPDAMVDTEVRQMAQDFANNLRRQGLSPDQYFKYTGMNPDTFMSNLKPQALKRIQTTLVLESIAAAEKLEAMEEDINSEIEEMAKNYSIELDKLKESIGEEEKKNIAGDIARKKALDFVRDSAVETKESAKSEESDEEPKKPARKPRKKKTEKEDAADNEDK